MKVTAKLMMLLLIAGGLTLSACDKGDDKQADDEQAQTEEPTEEEAEQEAEEEEPAEEEEEEEAEVDRDNYIEAAYQVACVEKAIEDVEKRKNIKSEIYARFGFDEESYAAASEQLKDDEAVKTAVETRMEKCTTEIAEGFAKAGEEGGEDEGAAEAEEEKKEVKKKPAAPKPATSGTFTGNLTGGIEKGTIKLRIKDDFSVSGTARLTAEGKTQPVAVRGKVGDDKTTVTATGNSGNTDIKVSGAIKGGKVMGSVSGKVYGKNFKSKFTASK